jgi:hypothetical protein
MSSLFNNTPGRPSTPYETGQMSQLRPGANQEFGRFGSLSDVTSLLQSKKITSPKSFARLMGPGLAQEFGFYNQNTGDRLNALQQAFGALDPSNRFGIASSYRSAAMGQAEEMARRNKGILRSRFGSQPSLDAGAELSALNSANSEAGGFFRQISDPRSIASNYLAQADAYGAGNVFQGLPMAMQAFGIAGQQQQKPSFLDTIAGIGGGLAGGGAFNGLF